MTKRELNIWKVACLAAEEVMKKKSIHSEFIRFGVEYGKSFNATEQEIEHFSNIPPRELFSRFHYEES